MPTPTGRLKRCRTPAKILPVKSHTLSFSGTVNPLRLEDQCRKRWRPSGVTDICSGAISFKIISRPNPKLSQFLCRADRLPRSTMTHPNVDELVQMISYYWQENIWLGVMPEGLLEERWHTGHGALLGGNFSIWCLRKYPAYDMELQSSL